MTRLADFEGLGIFAKVAEEGSFAAAARAMGVSVATVSRGVARIEERLGARLFNRTSRQLRCAACRHRTMHCWHRLEFDTGNRPVH